MSAPDPAQLPQNPLARYNSIGIILAGGGAKGAYQAGALSAIHDFLTKHNAHAKVRMIAGTSIGSWNALFWLAGLVGETKDSVVNLEKWWSTLSLRTLVRPAFYLPGLRNYFLTSSPWRRTFQTLFASDATTSARLLRHIQDPGGARSMRFYFTRSDVAGARLAVTTNRTDLGRLPANLPTREWLAGTRRVDAYVAQDLDDLASAVFSSMDLPPVFQYSRIKDQYYEDGGVIENLPIQFGTEAEQCDLLFIVPLNATFSKDIHHRSIIRRLRRIMDVRQGVIERNSFKMIYLYNELAALRQRAEELEHLAHRAYAALAGQAEDPHVNELLHELEQAAGPRLKGESAEEVPMAERALIRRHRRVQVFAICPAPRLAVNTLDFWKKRAAGEAFRLMRDVTAIELEKYFALPPDYVRVALVGPNRDVVYLEEF